MIYATLDDLVRVSVGGWAELAQRVTRDARVPGELLRAVASGTDTSAWSPESVGLAVDGVTQLNAQLAATSRHADTFLAARYPGGLSAEQLAVSDLSTVVATITMRRMYGQTVEETVIKATKWADDYLLAVANGVVSLGPAAGAGATSTDAEVLYEFSPRSVTDDDLRGFA